MSHVHDYSIAVSVQNIRIYPTQSVAQAMIECFLLFFPLGMAGTVYFLADLLEPKSSKFPAFEI